MSGMVPGTRSQYIIGLRHGSGAVIAILDSRDPNARQQVIEVEVMTPARARRLAAELIRRADEIDPPKACNRDHVAAR